MVKSNQLIDSIIEAAQNIQKVSTRGTANYIITEKNIGDILKGGFIKTTRIIKIKKILKNISNISAQ